MSVTLFNLIQSNKMSTEGQYYILYGDRAPACGGSKLWNAISVSLHSITFFKALKSYLFDKGYHELLIALCKVRCESLWS